MKKMVIAGLGLMIASLVALPAVAGNSHGHRGAGYKGKKHSHSYVNKNYDRRDYRRDLNKEWRKYQGNR